MNILIKQKESIKTKRLVLKSLSMNDIVDEAETHTRLFIHE